MRTLALLVSVALLGACGASVEITGLYANGLGKYSVTPPLVFKGTGVFFRCTQSSDHSAELVPSAVLWITDSALANQYQLTATRPSELLFARLRGVRADSGSIYSSSHHFLVQDVLELRKRTGECPKVGDSLPQALASW